MFMHGNVEIGAYNFLSGQSAKEAEAPHETHNLGKSRGPHTRDGPLRDREVSL